MKHKNIKRCVENKVTNRLDANESEESCEIILEAKVILKI